MDTNHTSKKKVGRPAVNLNEDEIIRMIGHGHSQRSVALFFRVSPTTINKVYGHLFEEYGGGKLAKINTLEVIWNQANKGNTLALRYLCDEFLNWNPTQGVGLQAFASSLVELSVDQLEALAQQKFKELKAKGHAEQD